MATSQRVRVPSRGQSHDMTAALVGPDIWSIECRSCPSTAKASPGRPPFFVEVAFSLAHRDQIIELHLDPGPSPAEVFREVLREGD